MFCIVLCNLDKLCSVFPLSDVPMPLLVAGAIGLHTHSLPWLGEDRVLYPLAVSGFTPFPWKSVERGQSCLICESLWGREPRFCEGKRLHFQKMKKEEGKVLDLLVPSHTVAFTAGEYLPHQDTSLEAP